MVSNVQKTSWLVVLFFLALIALVTVVAGESYADTVTGGSSASSSAPDDVLTGTICKAINLVQGGVGKAVAIVVIISIAIMMFLGKITWGVAIAVAVGIGLLFGAQGVVNAVSPSGSGELDCETYKNS